MLNSQNHGEKGRDMLKIGDQIRVNTLKIDNT